MRTRHPRALRYALAALLTTALAASLLLAAGASAGSSTKASAVKPAPVDISHRLKQRKAPEQPTASEAEAAVEANETTESQCGGNDDTLTITIPSFDAENPGDQDVVFWKETADTATGKATLWVAWDFLATEYGRQDVITCDQLEYLQAQMDGIVDTDVKYFGAYDERPAGNENIDVMIYNIVDESYFDETFPFYIAGFFWSSINEAFDRNMIFVDSYDWENRLGPDVERPFLYEGTVAHELQHLIHNDHDADEDSWIDEGMADLAEYLNGYGHPDGHVVYYLAFHRTSLTIWNSGLEDYGASYLFQLYLLENFGDKVGGEWDPGWTRTLIDEQANSIAGVEAATGADFEDLYDSWILANLVDDSSRTGPGDFPLGYDEIDLAPYHSDVYGDWSINRAITTIYGSDHQGALPVDRYYGGYVSGSVEWPNGDSAPYAPVYSTYRGLKPTLNYNFIGAKESGVAPVEGSWEVASGGGHLLTDRMLQLDTPVGGTLTFQTWYDIEDDWDYGFVEASTDGGSTWEPLVGSITQTSNNPNHSTAWENSLVSGESSTDAAITGSSGGWVEATFDLPAASDVLVRFSYYTDEAVNGRGWFIDDVAVDGFADGFESGTADWTLGGWTRTTGLFANDWITAYVNPTFSKGKPTGTEIEYVDGSVSGNFERINGSFDTQNLQNGEATIVFANRPGGSPFDSFFQLLAHK